MQRANPDWKTLVYCWAVISVAVFFISCRPAVDSSAFNDCQKIRTVNPGDPCAAIVYYGETLTELGLNPNNLRPKELVDSTNLSQVLVHMGYPDLDPKYVENTPSAELMKRFPGDVLSSAFFA